MLSLPSRDRTVGTNLIIGRFLAEATQLAGWAGFGPARPGPARSCFRDTGRRSNLELSTDLLC
jgi:hypothetical protein